VAAEANTVHEYFLHSQGQANTLLGNGLLNTAAPAKEPVDHYSYDPKRPVPTLGGNVAMHPPRVGPFDPTAVELRSDVLVYIDGDFSERNFHVISTTYNVLKDRPNT